MSLHSLSHGLQSSSFSGDAPNVLRVHIQLPTICSDIFSEHLPCLVSCFSPDFFLDLHASPPTLLHLEVTGDGGGINLEFEPRLPVVPWRLWTAFNVTSLHSLSHGLQSSSFSGDAPNVLRVHIQLPTICSDIFSEHLPCLVSYFSPDFFLDLHASPSL